MTVLAAVVVAACLYTPVDDIAFLYARYEWAPMFDNTGDFRWKDGVAAKRLGMDTKTYAIGGMEKRFIRLLARAFYAMEVAGLDPTINSAYRDNYRQSIITGGGANRPGKSFHGGSRVGGWGGGLAVDIVSAKATGATEKERLVASAAIWKWIDQHGAHYGIGRPYRGGDPPHVTPTWSREYTAIRGSPPTKALNRQAKKKVATR